VKRNIYDTIKDSGGFPVHCSHRGGCSSFGPENTMCTFRKSVQCKTRLLELDLQTTKDNHLILMHDRSVERTTNGEGDVDSFTLEELKKLDAAFYYTNLRGSGITVPTFTEFLDEFLPVENLMFMLDFKDDLSIKLTLEIVQQKKMAHRIILGSVFKSCNALLSKIKPPEVPLITDVSATVAIIGLYMTGTLSWYTFDHNIFGFILIPATAMFWSKGLVDAIHKAGVKVLVCGEELDKEERIKECIEYGVEFIMTDRPDILTNTLRSCKLMD